jgi:hypothetical protein
MQEAPTKPCAATGTQPAPDLARPRRSARLVNEATRFGVIFIYLWLLLGLLVLYESIIRRQIGLGFQPQAFALINALVLAKVMLVAEDLNLGGRLRGQPLICAILGEAALFMIVFIAFHVFESFVLGLVHGSTLAQSVPAFGGGGIAGLVTVAAIMFVILVPYFAFRDIGRALGPGELRRLLLTRPASAETADP